MKLQDLIRVYDDVAPDSFCDEAINLFEQNVDKSRLYDTEGYKFQQLDLMQAELPGVGFDFIKKFVLPKAHDYFNELELLPFVPQFPEKLLYENVRIKKYSKNEDFEFKTHVDVTNRETSTRFLIAILYLNDNDGNTSFTTTYVEPKKGRLLLMPPFWMFPHSGEKPTNSDKYIMMTSLNY